VTEEEDPMEVALDPTKIDRKWSDYGEASEDRREGREA